MVDPLVRKRLFTAKLFIFLVVLVHCTSVLTLVLKAGFHLDAITMTFIIGRDLIQPILLAFILTLVTVRATKPSGSVPLSFGQSLTIVMSQVLFVLLLWGVVSAFARGFLGGLFSI